MFPVNAIRHWSVVPQIRSVKALPAAADMKAAAASRNINILHPTVLIRVRYRVLPAADNIPAATARPGLLKGNTAAMNIIRRPVLRFAKAPMPTTVRTGKRSPRRTAVLSIGKTVRPNAKRLITTIVGTGPKFPASSAVLRILGIVCPNASPVKTTTAAIVRRLMRRMAAKLTGATVHRNAKRLIRTIAETKWRLSVPVRQMQPVPTFPTVPPKSVPGTVTTGMLSPVMSVLPKRKALVRIMDILRRSLWERNVGSDWYPNCQQSVIRTIASNAS